MEAGGTGLVEVAQGTQRFFPAGHGRKSPAPRLESVGSDSMDKNPASGCCFLPSRSSCRPRSPARGDGHAAKAAAPRSHAGGIFTRRGLGLGFPSPCRLQGRGRARRECPQGGRVQGMASSVLQPLHHVPGLSLNLKQPLREKLSPSCQLVPGFVPFPAGGIARSAAGAAGEERGLAEPEPSSWLTHGLPGCGAPAPGDSGHTLAWGRPPAPCSIPCHLPAAPACPRTAGFTRRQMPGEMQPPGGPGCLSPPWSGRFLSNPSHPSRGCPSGLCLGFPAASFWSLCAVFWQSQGKGAACGSAVPKRSQPAARSRAPGAPRGASTCPASLRQRG